MPQISIPNAMASRRQVFFGIAACAVTGFAAKGYAKENSQVPNSSASSFRVNFQTEEKKSGWAPMTLDAFSHLRIGATMNGMPVSAILDSGAASSVIDQAFVQRLGLPIQTNSPLIGITGTIQSASCHISSLTVGRMQVSHVTAAVVDLSSLNDPHNPPVQLILGREFFEAVLVDIDLPHQRVQFESSASRPSAAAGGDMLPLRQTTGGSRAFPVRVNDAPAAEAVFDLGYNAPLLISPEFAAKNGLLEHRPISTVASIGIEGMVVSKVATVDRLTIGRHVLTQVPIEVPPTWTRSTPIFVGLPLLSRFTILTDYAHNLISFAPDPALANVPVAKDHSGIGAQRVQNGLRIIHVSLNSPAAAAGLAVDDTIVTINGNVVDGAYLSSHPRMGTMPTGTRLDLGLADGRHLQITLGDYY